MKNEEERQIRKLKAGDEITFKRLFYLYSDRLFAWANNITRDPMAAADIVQDFFIRCWEKRDILPNNCSFKAYAYKSIYNASLNHIRDNKRFVQGYEITIDLIDDDVPDEDVEELKRLLLKAIDELPDRCKKIFVMTTLEKKKYVEVANLLGISVNTVKVQVSKAYRILREKIG
ncbi:RNA polymerase sigma factor [Proteiniphilum sp. UBA5384]|uniref:RNA polymerase sigma factor n=1 Tax=Proteiniphilum sp. UBA5384 TaxID=1947279 RepID=UPI0025E4E85F|nr:RNA polymerase sigma-70 factor [Proteiniphilum sp. UBA5384]